MKLSMSYFHPVFCPTVRKFINKFIKTGLFFLCFMSFSSGSAPSQYNTEHCEYATQDTHAVSSASSWRRVLAQLNQRGSDSRSQRQGQKRRSEGRRGNK